MPSVTKALMQPSDTKYFCYNKKGKLQLKSGFARFLSVILPYYYQGKVDYTAKEALVQLKNDYLHNKPSDLKFTARLLELHPSRQLASEINAYAYALSKKDVVENLDQFEVKIASKLSQRLENLGLTAEQQQRYPELMKMIEVNDLVDYMEGANWKIDQENWEGIKLSFASEEHDEPVLFVDGEAMPWSEAKVKIFGENLDASTSWKINSKEWRFDSNGISHTSMSKWVELTPCGKLPEHDGNYYLDIMSTTEGLNHNWVRLINSDGEVISAGLCGEIYSTAMMRNSIGKLNSPDHREFFKPETHRTTRILIDAKTYESIKSGKIETDQKNHNRFFSLMTRNCSKYACEVAAVAGCDLDNSEYPSQLFLRKLLHRVNIHLPKTLLKVIQKITSIPRIILGTGLAFAMGAWYQNANVKKKEKKYGHLWKVQPRKPFRSISSFFNGTNSVMASSMKVGEWQEFVKQYREKRLNVLHKQKEDAALSKLLEDPEFQAKWAVLECHVAYEMPPELESSYLFINDPKYIPTKDVEDRIQALMTA